MEFWTRFLIALLATWRVSHFLAREDGPAGVVLRLRRVLGSALDCFKCLSLWIAAPFACFVTLEPLPLVVTWLALSGGASLLDAATSEAVVIQDLSQSPKEEHRDGVLRSTSDSVD